MLFLQLRWMSEFNSSIHCVIFTYLQALLKKYTSMISSEYQSEPINLIRGQFIAVFDHL